MAILVSGGAGYIGSHTCIELLNAGYDVVVADNFYNASPVVLDRVKQITGKDFRFYNADMTKHEDVEKIFTECPDITAVIQFAAYKAVGESVSKPIEYYYNNLNCTVGKLEKVHVFGNDYPTPDGTGVRDYIHVVDLARGHVCAIRKLETNCGLFICNLGTGKGYSVLEVLHAFEKACGKQIPYVIDPRRPGDIAECYADPTKAKNELGWVAQYGIEDMCADSWNWQQKNPDGYNTAK